MFAGTESSPDCIPTRKRWSWLIVRRPTFWPISSANVDNSTDSETTRIRERPDISDNVSPAQQDFRSICGQPSGRTRRRRSPSTTGPNDSRDNPGPFAQILCFDHCPRDGDPGGSCGSFVRLCDRHAPVLRRYFFPALEVFVFLQLAVEVVAAISPYREQTLLAVEQRTTLSLRECKIASSVIVRQVGRGVSAGSNDFFEMVFARARKA